MYNLTVGVFGNRLFVNELGKKSTINDLAIHHHADSMHTFTFVAPNSEKVQPLLQALQMTEIPILVLKDLTPQVGEDIVGLSEMNFKHGFTILDNFAIDKYQKLVKDTPLERYEIISANVGDIYERLDKIAVERSSDVLVSIDNFFDVKGVGTVILGIMKSGTVNKYDKLILEPLGKEVVVKGIQIHDKDYDSASDGSRIGFNLKGIEVQEIKRGQVLCKTPCTKVKELPNKIIRNKFYKTEFKDNEQVTVSAGLQCVVGMIKADKIVLDKEMALLKPVLVASTRQENLRIIGKIVI